MNPFVYEICEYLGSKTSFTFGTDVYVGELKRDVDGVYAVESPSQNPDMYTATEYHDVDFYIKYARAVTTFEKAQIVYNLFHRLHHYTTTSFDVYFSYATSPVADLDREFENGKLLRLSVRFICRNLNYIS